jgi:RHS repeat-associated protein
VGDHLGSTTLLVDTSGPPTVVQRQYYTPYGTSAFQYTAHGSLTSVDFTDQRLDESSGLLYFGARYYDAGLAYFVSADPTSPEPKQALSADWNRYLYTRGNPLRYVDSSGYGPQDHYVFVAGCVFNPCSDEVPRTAFGDYMDLLRDLFDAGGWGYALASTIGGHAMSFDQWAATHVHTANVSSLDDGAARINHILRSEIPTGDFNMHLFGTSQGGAALLQYITYTLPGTASEGHGSIYQLDSRIASFITVDSPLNHVAGQWPNVPGFNVGTYLAQNTRVKTMESGVDADSETALTIDGRDFVNHFPIDGVRKMSDPNWSDPAPFPHTQHTRQYAPNTKSFFMRVWR